MSIPKEKADKMTDEQRREYNRIKVAESRARKKEATRERTLEEKLERELNEPDNIGKAQALLNKIFWLRKTELIEDIVWELENPLDPPFNDVATDLKIDEFLAVYEHRGPFSPTGSHPIGRPWNFDFMKTRLRQTKIGRLLLDKYGQTAEAWQASRQGKQDVA